jgi:hypothetical protein
MAKSAPERLLDALLLDAYQRAKKEAKYNATVFFRMLSDRGGLETAKYLINAPGESNGYTELYLRERLDLTLEAVVVENRSVQSLFTDDELAIAEKRLRDRGYTPQMRD